MKALFPVVLRAPPPLESLAGREKVLAQSAHARVALARSAALSHAELGELVKNADDAPLPSHGWHWSLSHAARFAVGAVARLPLGVDVEPIRARRADLVERVAAASELELFGAFAWEHFARVWTAKEAVLKKAGVGLLELERCRLVGVEDEHTLLVEHRERRHRVHQLTRAGYVAALAHDGARELAVRWTWEDD